MKQGALATQPGMLRFRAASFRALALPLAVTACGAHASRSVTTGSGGATTTPGTACVPGAQVVCACPGGKQGAQVCDPDGSGYAPCFGCDTGSGGNGGSTTSSSTTTACVPGAQVVCACPGGKQGAQVCDPDGSGYAPCFGC